MKIDEDLMEKYEASLEQRPSRVRLAGGNEGEELYALVMPCNMFQWTQTCEMLGEMMEIRAVLTDALGGFEKGNEHLVGRIVDFIEKAPHVLARWTEIMQPRTNVDLKKVSLQEFAWVAVEFFVSSFRGPGQESWAEMGKKLSGMFGPPIPDRL